MPRLADWVGKLLASGLRFDAQTLSQADAMTRQLGALTWAWMVVLLPLGAVGIALALSAALASGGWNFTWKPLAPNFGKLNPLKPVWAAWWVASTWVTSPRPARWR